jgi:hypothetical protein
LRSAQKRKEQELQYANVYDSFHKGLEEIMTTGVFLNKMIVNAQGT